MGWEKQADEFVSKYCVKHQVTYREALGHAIVKEVIEYYKAAESGKMSATEWYAGCGCIEDDKSC